MSNSALASLISGDRPATSTKDRISIETFKLLNETRGTNVTINQVCKAVGITKSTFYYYYHSIDDVIESFSDIITQSLTDQIPAIFQERTCVAQALLAVRIVDEAVETLGVSVAASRYLLHLKKGDYPGFQAEAGWFLILAILTKAIELKELPNKNTPEELATSVFYIMRGVNLTWCMRGGAFPFVETVQKELQQFFDQYCAMDSNQI